MREPHLSQTSRCRVGVAVPLSSVPIVVVSLLPPVGAGTHHQDGLTQLNLHPFAGNFRIPIWYPPARLGRLPRQARRCPCWIPWGVARQSPPPRKLAQLVLVHPAGAGDPLGQLEDRPVGRLQLARVHRHPLSGRRSSPMTTTEA